MTVKDKLNDKSYLKVKNDKRDYDTIESKEANQENKKKMNYDEILEELGELGPWQILNLVLLWIPSIASGMWVLTYSFSGTEGTMLQKLSKCEVKA